LHTYQVEDEITITVERHPKVLVTDCLSKAHNIVRARPTRFPEQKIIASVVFIKHENIVASSIEDYVITRARLDNIIPVTTVHSLIAFAAEDKVVARVTAQDVIACPQYPVVAEIAL
jgi:hypothetical protein